MNNPFQIRFTLKQHTPILHFLHDQDGATLRGSDVKPRLDKFIRENYKGEFPEEWFLQKTKSLNYQINFQSKNTEKYSIQTFFSTNRRNVLNQNNENYFTASYFGDNIGLFHSENTGEIKSTNKDLIVEIKKMIPYFFAVNNFGTRQSKGFGSFTVENIDGEKIKQVTPEKIKKYSKCIALYTKAFNNSDFKIILSKISDEYQHLKSGINRPNYYVKSLLFLYFCNEKNIKWDKRWIKQQLKLNGKEKILRYSHEPINCNISNEFDINYNNNEYKYIRALLGIADNTEWQKSLNNNPYLQDMYQSIQISMKNNQIERFRSPITYKIIENDVYMLCYDSYKGTITNKEFSLSIDINSNNTKTNLGLNNINTIFTPADNYFDLKEFIDWVISYNTTRNIIENHNRENYKYKPII